MNNVENKNTVETTSTEPAAATAVTLESTAKEGGEVETSIGKETDDEKETEKITSSNKYSTFNNINANTNKKTTETEIMSTLTSEDNPKIGTNSETNSNTASNNKMMNNKEVEEGKKGNNFYLLIIVCN